MATRIEGRLKTWNSDKGFGFISPSTGGPDIFVHISDYPRRDGLPRVGEPLTFLVSFNQDGKKKAVNVQRPNSRPSAPYRTRAQPAARSSMGFRLIALLVVVALAAAGYKYFARKPYAAQPLTADPDVVVTPELSSASSAFRCDGRKHCSQMTSCKEAKYFLQNCPGTEMDGDGDGIPCESQWCTGMFSK